MLLNKLGNLLSGFGKKCGHGSRISGMNTSGLNWNGSGKKFQTCLEEESIDIPFRHNS